MSDTIKFVNIILLGYRGCGKSTLGKKLADHLWMKFVDTDREVCKRFDNQTIAQIWQELGEQRWREVEAEVVEAVCRGDGQVIALGGGALTRHQAVQAVKEAKNSVRIYLLCSPEELHRRIQADPQSNQSRPALSSLNGQLAEIQAVLAQRDPLYRSVADKVFEVTNLRPDGAFKHLVDKCL